MNHCLWCQLKVEQYGYLLSRRGNEINAHQIFTLDNSAGGPSPTFHLLGLSNLKYLDRTFLYETLEDIKQYSDFISSLVFMLCFAEVYFKTN